MAGTPNAGTPAKVKKVRAPKTAQGTVDNARKAIERITQGVATQFLKGNDMDGLQKLLAARKSLDEALVVPAGTK